MSLEDKSNENIKLVNNYVTAKRYYDIAASRAYFAIYQRIKHYLQKQEIDYTNFLNASKMTFIPNNIYKHSLINLVLWKYTLDKNKGKGIDLREINQLHKFQTLRQIREKADYRDNSITEPEAQDSRRYANELMPIIDKYLS